MGVSPFFLMRLVGNAHDCHYSTSFLSFPQVINLSNIFLNFVIIDSAACHSTMSTMDRNELWQKVLGEVELQISRPNFITWFKNSSITTKNDGVVIIGLPNNFAREWVENKYHKIILGTLRTIDSGIRKVEYILVKETNKTDSVHIKIAHAGHNAPPENQ